jgi:tellurite resistance protein TehA-like permease
MACGILSVGADRDGLGTLSWVLIALALAIYAALIALRVPRMAADMRRDPIGSLTFVAGTCVLATRLADPARWPALGLLCVGAIAWVLLAPGAYGRLLRVPAPEAGGSLLLAVVAPASLAIAAAGLSVSLPARVLERAALVLWVLAAASYPVIASKLCRRLVRSPRTGRSLTPDWWIVSGAASITSVAAAALVTAGTEGPLEPLATVLWSVAAAAFVALVAAEARGRIGGPIEARYSTVFPLGMFAVACSALGGLIGRPVLDPLSDATLVVAIVIFAGVSVAAVWRRGSSVRQGDP